MTRRRTGWRYPSAATRADSSPGPVFGPVGVAVETDTALALSAAPATFSTTFSANENPISEGGNWDRSATSFKAVRTLSGYACGAAYTDANDDAWARLTPSAFTSPTGGYEVTVTVRKTSFENSEIEILGFLEADASSMWGYEVLVNTSGGGELVRLDGGGPGGYYEFDGNSGRPNTLYTISSWTGDGDKIRARFTVSGGNPRIQMWHAPAATPTTWTQYIDQTDTHANRRTTGQPGMGFYQVTANGALLVNGFADYSVVSV